MRIKLLVLAGVLGLLATVPLTAADRSCCDNSGCCDTAAATCCKKEVAPTAIDVLFEAARVPLRVIPANEPPVRQTMVVNFRDPVRIGDRILMGKYIIEHDNNRMAQGRACTYIYSAKDPRLPLVTFHCTHLTRPRVDSDTVALVSIVDFTGTKRLTEFQFAGESAAHGVPRK